MDYGKLALKRIEELSDYIRLAERGDEVKKYSVSSGESSFSLAKDEKKEKVVRVSLADDGDLKVKFFVSVSGGNCLKKGTLDGQTLLEENTSGSTEVVRICSSVEKGEHEIRLSVTAGGTVTVDSLSVTAEGNIDKNSDKIFIDADKNGSLFLEKNLSRVSVNKFVNGKKNEIYAFYGVSYARIKKISGKYYLFGASETGQAFLLEIAEDGSAPKYCFIDDDVVCIDGVATAGGNIVIFVGKENTIAMFVFDSEKGSAGKCAEFDGGADEISVSSAGNGYAIVTTNSGGVYLSVSEGVVAEGIKEKFTLSITES